MATEMKIWQVSSKEGLVPVHDTPMESIHLDWQMVV